MSWSREPSKRAPVKLKHPSVLRYHRVDLSRKGFASSPLESLDPSLKKGMGTLVELGKRSFAISSDRFGLLFNLSSKFYKNVLHTTINSEFDQERPRKVESQVKWNLAYKASIDGLFITSDGKLLHGVISLTTNEVCLNVARILGLSGAWNKKHNRWMCWTFPLMSFQIGENR